MLNHIVLIGRLTKDPDLRYTPSGKAVASLRLAVDRGTKSADGKSETDFVDVVVWEKQAEFAGNYLSKGRLVAVQGRLQIRQYEDNGGSRREKAEVVASQLKSLERPQDSTNAPDRAGPSPRGEYRPAPSGNMGSELNFGDDDDVPF